MVIYELNAWDGFLLPGIAPRAMRMPAIVGETGDEVINRLGGLPAIFVFHANLTRCTRVPVNRSRLASYLTGRGVKVINAGITDISKSAVHRACVAAGIPIAKASRSGDANEPLLVKTEYNCNCLGERRLTAAERRVAGCEELPDDILADGFSQYLVAARKDVAAWIWESPHFVVERYVTNQEHRFYRTYLAGHNTVISKVIDPSVFKKMPVGILRQNYYFEGDSSPWDGFPEEVVRAAAISTRFARAARMDFGALDVVSDEGGTLFIVDANTTPHWGNGGHPRILSHLAEGLRATGPRERPREIRYGSDEKS